MEYENLFKKKNWNENFLYKVAVTLFTLIDNFQMFMIFFYKFLCNKGLKIQEMKKLDK